MLQPPAAHPRLDVIILEPRQQSDVGRATMEGDFRIGAWLVQPRLNSISGEGKTAHVEPKMMQVLVHLAEHAGEVVPKESLIREIWADTFVTDDVLTRAVSGLRKALGDSARKPRVIQTVSKSGYRLIAPVGAREGPAAVRSLAVLPLVNASGDPEIDYFCDGITESLISSLSALPPLRVMARSTVFHYKGKETDARSIGRELKVDAVLTGRVVQRGETLTLDVELVDVERGWRLWGEQFARAPRDVLVVQDEISREISRSLRLRLTGEERKRLVKRYTENAQAYQLYLRGRYCWNRRTGEALKQGLEYFRQAIDLDPAYALAHTGLADSYYVLADYGHVSPREAFPQAKLAALRALEIDDTLAEAHTSFGWGQFVFDWEWSVAEREFRRSLELNPGYPTAHHWYSEYLTAMGRHDEALAEIQYALELDPLSLVVNGMVGVTHYFARRYEQAVEWYRKTLELDSHYRPAYRWLGLTYERMGRADEAVGAYLKARSLSGFGAAAIPALEQAYAESGIQGYWRLRLAHLTEQTGRRHVSPYPLAMGCAYLGESGTALDWLEKAFEARDPGLTVLRVDPRCDPLSSEPRFQALLRRMNLPP